MTTDLLGLAAAALVLITFSVRSLQALRCFAIASNLLFIGYGIAGHLIPILLLHALLLPLNLCRLWQLRRASKNRVPAMGCSASCMVSRPVTNGHAFVPRLKVTSRSRTGRAAAGAEHRSRKFCPCTGEARPPRKPPRG